MPLSFLHISKYKKLWYILLAGILLLSAPCPVRHFIQDSLGTERTDVSNRHRAVLPLHSSCNTAGNNILQLTGQSFTRQHKKQLPGEAANTADLSIQLSVSLSQTDSPYQLRHLIPLYILYKRLRIQG